MDLKQYKTLALQTESKPAALAVHPIGLHRALTVCIEAAEMLNLLKRTMFYGKELSEVQFHGKLADIVNACMSLANDVRGLKDPNSGMVPYLKNEEKADAKNLNLRIAHGGIGIFTEAGEVLEQVRACLETGLYDKVNLAEEVGGDIPWYQAVIYDEADIDPEEALERNIGKLQGRYKTGEFTQEEAINRDVAAERQILEGKRGKGAKRAKNNVESAGA